MSNGSLFFIMRQFKLIKERAAKWRQRYVDADTGRFFFRRDVPQRYPFNGLHLLSVEHESQLCKMLDVTLKAMSALIHHPAYTTFEISKKKGGKRTIEAPDEDLKEVQRRLNYYLNAYYLMIKPASVFGFVIQPKENGRYCAIAENARPHVGKKQVLNIDIKDFFPAIKAGRVKALFTSEIFGYNEHLATLLALLVTHKGALPVGAPTSPAIANFICYPLDMELMQFCSDHGLTYTRYADDLTFSAEETIDTDDILDIVSIINSHHFAINEKKFRIRSAHQQQMVTGVVVNRKVNIDRKLIRRVRAILHDIQQNGLIAATMRHFRIDEMPDDTAISYFSRRTVGLVNFIGQVKGPKDPVYLRYKRILDDLFPSYVSSPKTYF